MDESAGAGGGAGGREGSLRAVLLSDMCTSAGRRPGHVASRPSHLHHVQLSYSGRGSCHHRLPPKLPGAESCHSRTPGGEIRSAPAPQLEGPGRPRRAQSPKATGPPAPSSPAPPPPQRGGVLINTFPLLPTFLIRPAAAQSFKKKKKKKRAKGKKTKCRASPAGRVADVLCSPETHLALVLQNKPHAPQQQDLSGGRPPNTPLTMAPAPPPPRLGGGGRINQHAGLPPGLPQTL